MKQNLLLTPFFSAILQSVTWPALPKNPVSSFSPTNLGMFLTISLLIWLLNKHD